MIEIVNNISFGFGVGVWSCDVNVVFCVGWVIEVGCVWMNCYYLYLVYVVFGGYKKLGIGCEIYKMMLDYY